MDLNKNRFDYLSKPSTSSATLDYMPKMSSGIIKTDPTLYKRRTVTSYTDYAYREAMNRLKNLLSEPYTPPGQLTTIYQRPVFESTSSFAATSPHSHHTFPGRPSMQELSKFFPGTNILRASGYSQPCHSIDTPSVHELPCSQQQSNYGASGEQSNQELLRFIERQENYIKNIERDYDQSREEMKSMKFKIEELMHENENLQRMANDSDSEADYGKTPTIVLESKITQLEAQLSQEKIEVKRLKEDNASLKQKLATGEGLEVVEKYKYRCDELLRDKQRLEDEVRRLEIKIESMRSYESSHYSKSLRDSDLSDMGIEKSHLQLEIKRLKDDLEYQKERYESLQNEMTRRIAEEREIALRGSSHSKFEPITCSEEISSKWEYASKLQYEIDRHKRVESDLKREISQKNIFIEDLKAEYRHKIKNFQTELMELNTIRDTLESENNHLKLQLERQERQAQADTTRLNNETASLRQRLDRADADLAHARREQLRLNEQISVLEKELAISDATRDTSHRPELSRIINDMEHKHASTVNELEGMITSQKELMEKLTAECKTLTHKLEDTTLKHKEDISSLQTNLQTLSNKLISNPSITSAPLSSLTQSNNNPLSSFMTNFNINSKNDENDDKKISNQENRSKVDSIYDSIISTTVDNLSSLSHSLTNQMSTMSLSKPNNDKIFNIDSSGQDQVQTKEPNIYEAPARSTVVEQSPRKHAPLRRIDSQTTIRASPTREVLQRYKSTDSIQSASGYEKPYSKQAEYGGMEKDDSNDMAIEENIPKSALSSSRRGSMSKSSSRNEFDRRYESPTLPVGTEGKVNVNVVSKTFEVGGLQRSEQQPEQQQQQQSSYYSSTPKDQTGKTFGYEKADDEYNREKVEERRFSPEKPPLPPSAIARLESPSRHQSESRYSPEANRQAQQQQQQMPQYQTQSQYYGQPQQESVQDLGYQQQNEGFQQPYQQNQYDTQRYEYEQQQQQQQQQQMQFQPQQQYSQGYQEMQQPTGYQDISNMQEQYQPVQEPRYDAAQEQQYRPDYGAESQQQQQYPIQQYRESDYKIQSQPEQSQIFNAPEYEQQQQYQLPSQDVIQQQQQPQQYQSQDPVGSYAQQNLSGMQTTLVPGQYQEFVDTSGYVESRQGRDAESTLYQAPTGSMRDSPTLDQRSRQSPTNFQRQQSPTSGGTTSAIKQPEPTASTPQPVKKSPSPPAQVTTEVVPPVTQISQTIRKEVPSPSTTSTARRTRPPTLRSVTARARAAASSRGGNR